MLAEKQSTNSRLPAKQHRVEQYGLLFLSFYYLDQKFSLTKYTQNGKIVKENILLPQKNFFLKFLGKIEFAKNNKLFSKICIFSKFL